MTLKDWSQGSCSAVLTVRAGLCCRNQQSIPNWVVNLRRRCYWCLWSCCCCWCLWFCLRMRIVLMALLCHVSGYTDFHYSFFMIWTTGQEFMWVSSSKASYMPRKEWGCRSDMLQIAKNRSQQGPPKTQHDWNKAAMHLIKLWIKQYLWRPALTILTGLNGGSLHGWRWEQATKNRQQWWRI